jgi:hypothetical protein
MINPTVVLWMALWCVLLTLAAGAIEAPSSGSVAPSSLSTLAYASRVPRYRTRNTARNQVRTAKYKAVVARRDARRKPRAPRFMDAGRESDDRMDGIMESVIAF